MDENQMIWNDKIAKDIIKQLEKRRMEGSYAPDAKQAKQEILAMIPEGATVYRGGSMTAVGMNLWEEIEKLPGVELLDPFRPEISPEEGMDLRRRGLTADLMIASSNAVTLDGKLVNLDGMGRQPLASVKG